MIEFLSSPWTLGGFIALVTGGGISGYVFFPTIAAAFVGSATGRKALLLLLALGITLLIVRSIFKAGERKKDDEAKLRQLEVLRIRVKKDDELSKMPLEQRKKEFEKWSN